MRHLTSAPMNIYRDAASAEMREAHGKIVGLALNGTEPDPTNSKDGGRYRIRTYDFHRVKMALYR